MELVEILKQAVGSGASDIHLVIGKPAMMRVNGDKLGEIRIWDRQGEQLVVKGAEEALVGRELGARNSRALRELLQ